MITILTVEEEIVVAEDDVTVAKEVATWEVEDGETVDGINKEDKSKISEEEEALAVAALEVLNDTTVAWEDRDVFFLC